jgi:hypothetical protein
MLGWEENLSLINAVFNDCVSAAVIQEWNKMRGKL